MKFANLLFVYFTKKRNREPESNEMKNAEIENERKKKKKETINQLQKML